MIAEQQSKVIEHFVNELLGASEGYFLVDLYIKPTNNIKIFIDADQGASIDHLTKLNRALYKKIEDEGMFPNGDFSLEVSSPGLDEPLKMHRQYMKNLGRPVEVLMKNGIKYEGKLLSASNEEIIVEEEKGHKKQRQLIEHRIPIEEIKSTKIQIKF